MVSTRFTYRPIGRVLFEVVKSNGEKRYLRWYNTITNNMRRAVASALAEQSIGVPAKIVLGDGALAQYPISNYNTVAKLGDTGQEALAQGFNTNDPGTHDDPIPAYALLYLKRVGTSAGTLQAHIYNSSAGLPTTLVKSSELVNVDSLLSSDFSWIQFVFDDADSLPNGTYQLVLTSSGYTFSDGVTEVQWGIDNTPAYTAGAFNKYNGSAWSDYGGADGIFRIVAQTDDSWEAVYGELVEIDIVGRSRQGNFTARLLGVVQSDEAIDWIGHVGLLDEADNLLAAATVGYEKEESETVNVYWLIEIL